MGGLVTSAYIGASVLFNEFSRNSDWPVAAAVAIVLLFPP